MDIDRIEKLVASGRDFPIVIASTPTSRQEYVIAACFITLLCLTLAVVAPIADLQLARLDVFVPAVQSVMSVVDLITAALLLAQYSVLPKPAILALASGYIFSALFAFVQTLTFPGAYSANGLFGDGTNTPAWLFVLWHASFSLSVIAYALLKNVEAPSRTSPRVTIVFASACIVVVTAALTWAATAAVEYLPAVYQGTTQQTRVAIHLNLFLWLLSLAAFFLLLVRRRTALDTWLLVVLIALWPNFLAAIFLTAVRFSLGWYTTRFFSLIASSILLFALLAGTTVLYARLANAIYLLRRERSDRLMSLEAAAGAIAHEIGQPLAGIALSSSAGLRWLNREPPQLDNVAKCLAAVGDASNQANEVLASVRRLFDRVTTSQRTMQHVNDIVIEAMKLVDRDLQVTGVSLTTKLSEDLPQINVDRMQIQQVVSNLLKNAVEAMHSSPEGKRHLRVGTCLNVNSSVSVLIEDTGPGIGEKDRDSIFQPFVTTKATGTGLGLSICRTIVENHGGKLALAHTSARGSIFEVLFPIDLMSKAK
jgi:signal transduction histidine kinase